MRRVVLFLIGTAFFAVTAQDALAQGVRTLGGRNGRYWYYDPFYYSRSNSYYGPSSPSVYSESYYSPYTVTSLSPTTSASPANGWYGNYAYGTSPWTSRQGAMTRTTTITPASYSPMTRQTQWGLRVDNINSGGAAQNAKLEKGDIIIGVGPMRTQTFEELQQALAATNGPTELTFWNVDTKNTERVLITPVNGKIGVTVTPVDLP